MKARHVIAVIILLLYAMKGMSQCIVYEGGMESVPGEVVIEWQFDPDCKTNRTGTVKDKTFVLKITSMFEDFILQDTVVGNRYRFNSRIGNDESMLITAKVLGSSESTRESGYTILKMNANIVKLLPMETRIDSLNMFLLNGCFFNAKAILEDMNREDWLTEIRKQYGVIFPRGYYEQINFFNSYVDSSTKTLVQMPYVDKTDELIKALNQATKDRNDKPLDITILLKVSPANELQDFAVYPASETGTISGLLPLLQFDNRRKVESMVLLKINRPNDKKKSTYEMVNTRALIDPDSPGFKKYFVSPTGAVHR